MTAMPEREESHNRHSELLNGKRPASDARLIRDIFRADNGARPGPRTTSGAAASGSSAQARKRHDAHLEPKPSHQPGVVQWD